jgi:hypothetical protein
LADSIQKQVIEVLYEATEAERAARARSTAEIKRIKDEKEAARKAAKEAAEAQKQAAKEAADAQKKAAKEAADAQKKAAKEAADTERAEKKRTTEIQRTEDRQILREYKDRVNGQIREAKRLAAAEVRAAAEAERAKRAAAVESTKTWEKQNQAIEGAVKGAAMFGAGMVGLSSASSILATITERFDKLRAASTEHAQKLIDEAAEMRSLSALMGQMGRPSSTYAEILKMTGKTYQTPAEARELVQGAMATGFGAIAAGLVSQADMKKLLEYQGRRQVILGESPRALGELVGMLPLLSEKKGQTAEELEALNQRLFELQRLGGFESYEQGMGQLKRASAYTMKGIYTAPMAQALLSAFADAGPQEEAATSLEHATRAVTVGMMRNRGMKVLPEEADQFMRTAEYFKTLTDARGNKLTDQTAPEERLMAVVRDIMAAEDTAHKAGRQFYATDYLTHKGFINQQDMLALAALTGVERKGMLGQLMTLGRAPLTPHQPGTGLDVEWEAFKRDPVGAQIIARREAEIASRAEEGGVGEFRNLMMARAYAKLGGKEAFGDELETIQNRNPWHPYEILGGQLVPHSKAGLQLAAQQELVAEALRSGVDVGSLFPGCFNPRTQQLEGGFVGWEELFGLSQKTGERGGTILPGADPLTMGRNIQRIADGIDDLRGQKAGGPPNAVGAAGPRAAGPPPALPGPQPVIAGGGRP